MRRMRICVAVLEATTGHVPGVTCTHVVLVMKSVCYPTVFRIIQL